MKDLYWVGIKESDIDGCKDLYEGSITILGSGKDKNISYSSTTDERINHNDIKNLSKVTEWINNTLLKILDNNSNAKFMFYNQISMYEYDENIRKNSICCNEKELIDSINNKFFMRDWMKNYVPVLDYKYCTGLDILSKEIKEQLVVQAKNSNGGSDTFLLNSKTINNIKLNKDELYCVSKYCEKNIPINIHCIISEKEISLFPSLIQVIRANNTISSRGCDFIEYRKVENEIKERVEKYSLEVCKQLQQKGYLGICGIDYIIYEDEVYFMEVNPRFQSSTNVLNMALSENNQKTLNELCIRAFNNESIETSKIDVNYSKYIFEEDDFINELKVPCYKMQADGFDKNQKIISGAYKYSCIYNKNICKIVDNSYIEI